MSPECPQCCDWRLQTTERKSHQAVYGCASQHAADVIHSLGGNAPITQVLQGPVGWTASAQVGFPERIGNVRNTELRHIAVRAATL